MNNLEEVIVKIFTDRSDTTSKAKLLLHVALLAQAIDEGIIDRESLKTLIDFI